MGTTAPWRRFKRAALFFAVLSGLGGCARDPNPPTLAVPAAAAAGIRMRCLPGSFIGTMTVNCPQVAR